VKVYEAVVTAYAEGGIASANAVVEAAEAELAARVFSTDSAVASAMAETRGLLNLVQAEGVEHDDPALIRLMNDVRCRLVAAVRGGRERSVSLAAPPPIKPPTVLRPCLRGGSLLDVGDIMLFAGRGGIGKSLAAVQIGMAMARGDRVACGFELFPDNTAAVGDDRAVTVLYAGAEDADYAVFDRVTSMADAWLGGKVSRPEGLRFMDISGMPLYGVPVGASYNSSPGPLDPAWPAFWGEAERIGARVVIIDPVKAICGFDANNAMAVNGMFSAVREQARRIGCAVMMTAHPTKLARNKHAEVGGEGAVAGSAAFTDSVRGVVAMHTLWNRPAEVRETRYLSVIKANHGATSISIGLEPVTAPVTPGSSYERPVLFKPSSDAWESELYNDMDAGAPTPAKGGRKAAVVDIATRRGGVS